MPTNTLPHKTCRFCGYEWIPRVARPKACPCCMRRNFEQREEVSQGRASKRQLVNPTPGPEHRPVEVVPGD